MGTLPPSRPPGSGNLHQPPPPVIGSDHYHLPMIKTDMVASDPVPKTSMKCQSEFQL